MDDASAAVETTPAAPQRVLVIAEERDIAELSESILQSDGFAVSAEITRGDLATVDVSSYAVVFLAMGNEPSRLLDALRELRRPNDLPIIISSRLHIHKSALSLYKSLAREGAFDFLTFPFSRETLLMAIRRAFAWLRAVQEQPVQDRLGQFRNTASKSPVVVTAFPESWRTSGAGPDEESALALHDLLQLMLKQEDFELQLIDNSEEILRKLDAGARIVIITSTVPEAMALLAEIRDRHPGVFVILWTGCQLGKAPVSGLLGEIFAVLQKPSYPWAMIHTITLAQNWPGIWRPR
jgi:DNA-binding NtrC family response regulator